MDTRQRAFRDGFYRVFVKAAQGPAQKPPPPRGGVPGFPTEEEILNVQGSPRSVQPSPPSPPPQRAQGPLKPYPPQKGSGGGAQGLLSWNQGGQKARGGFIDEPQQQERPASPQERYPGHVPGKTNIWGEPMQGPQFTQRLKQRAQEYQDLQTPVGLPSLPSLPSWGQEPPPRHARTQGPQQPNMIDRAMQSMFPVSERPEAAPEGGPISRGGRQAGAPSAGRRQRTNQWGPPQALSDFARALWEGGVRQQVKRYSAPFQ